MPCDRTNSVLAQTSSIGKATDDQAVSSPDKFLVCEFFYLVV